MSQGSAIILMSAKAGSWAIRCLNGWSWVTWWFSSRMSSVARSNRNPSTPPISVTQ